MNAMSDQPRGDDDAGTSIRPGTPPPGQPYRQPPPAQQQPAPHQPAQQQGQYAPRPHDTAPLPAYQQQHPQWQSGYPQQPVPPPAPRGRDRKRGGGGGLGILAAALVLGAGAGFGGAALHDETTGGGSPGGSVDANQIDTGGVDLRDLVSVQTVAKQALPTVVKIESIGATSGSTGSGIILSEDGEILTNYHVAFEGIDGTMEVFFNDGTTAEAEVVGFDESMDIALIKAKDVSGLPTARLGESDKIDVGQAVVAVGSPYGLDATVTAGIISTLNRPVAVPGMEDPDVPMIYPALQTDAAINPGNSGGALVNITGELIGVNSANKLASSGDPYSPGDLGSIGIGWAIPIHVIEPILEQLRAGEDPTHAWLGIVPGNATDAGVPQGALVKELDADGAAERAGVRTGDIVIAIDDWKIQEQLGLVTTALEYRPGDEVTLTVLRDGEQQELPVTLGEKGNLFD